MDNGIAPAAGEPRYALSTTLSARVGLLNPRWNEPDQDTEVGTAPAAPRDTLTGDGPLGDTADPRVPRRGSGGPWSWWAASSWSAWTSTTGPGCPHGLCWKRPSSAALR